MSDTNTNTTVTAGAFTLSGWVADFTTIPGSNTDVMLLPTGTSYDFNWSGNTIGGDSYVPPSPGPLDPGNTLEPSQQIGATESNSDLATLKIQIDGGAGDDSNVTVNSGATVLVNGGTPGSSFTIGSTTGEDATQLQSDIQSLTIVDGAESDNFNITFTLTDVGSGSGPVGSPATFTEFFKVTCYAPGTRIATPAGEVAVEDLQIGDLVATTSGVAKPVKWIGRRSYSAAAVADAANLRPVVIRKGALAAGLPRHDLVVSPMHALLIDDVFVPAAALVNGVSIVRRETAGAVEYIHVELDQHDVILAEGVPAETFVDDNSRALFENVSEYYDLYGIAESQRGFSAPRIEEGYQLEAIRRRLAGVAPPAVAPGALAGHVERLDDGMLEGWVMDRANPTAPVELEVLVDGEIVATVLANRYRVDLDRADLAGGRCAFTVAMPAAAENLAQIEVRRASDGGQVAMPQRALVTA